MSEFREISPDILSHMSNDELIEVHGAAHSRMKDDPDSPNEDLINAHVFIWLEMRRRGIPHKLEDKLDSESKFWAQGSQPLPRISKSEGDIISLEEFIESLPEEIELPRTPYIELVGGVVNRGFSTSDVDLKIYSSFNPVTAKSILSQIDERYRGRVHLIWEPGESVEIGKKIPIYRRGLKKIEVDIRHGLKDAVNVNKSEESRIPLEGCIYYKDDEICPLYSKFSHPWDGLEKGAVREKLVLPISCEFASQMKCRYVKDDYYKYEGGSA